MRPYANFVLALCVGSSLCGCAVIQDIQNKRSKALDDYHDENHIVGEEGRADQPRTKESDWLTPWIQSPEARSIEKNLGVD